MPKIGDNSYRDFDKSKSSHKSSSKDSKDTIYLDSIVRGISHNSSNRVNIIGEDI